MSKKQNYIVKQQMTLVPLFTNCLTVRASQRHEVLGCHNTGKSYRETYRDIYMPDRHIERHTGLCSEQTSQQLTLLAHRWLLLLYVTFLLV